VSAPATEQPSQPSNSSDLSSQVPRLRRWRYRARRARLGSTLTLMVATLVIGIAIGRWTAPPEDQDAQRLLEEHVVPLVLDADGIWTSASDGARPVSDALVTLQRDEDPSLVLEEAATWLAAYDEVLGRVAGHELPPDARPVQRQFIAAITLSRDAVEVLHRAAQVEDPGRRQGLLMEVERLRTRGEQLTQTARASILDVSGRGGRVTRLPDLPPFPAVS
jgi:hypothetical protein